METKIFALKAHTTNEGLVSSIVNEVIRTSLTLFFNEKISHAQKSIKSIKNVKSTKTTKSTKATKSVKKHKKHKKHKTSNKQLSSS